MKTRQYFRALRCPRFEGISKPPKSKKNEEHVLLPNQIYMAITLNEFKHDQLEYINVTDGQLISENVITIGNKSSFNPMICSFV